MNVLVYNLADTFFIGQTHNPFQVAAISLATPVFLIFMSIGNVFGIGGTSVISRALGEGKKEYTKKVCSFCFWSCVVVGIIISIAFLIFLDKIVVALGASNETLQFTKDYLTIIAFSGPFVLITSCYSNILRAEGQATKAMMGQIIGNVLNIILDPLLILSLNFDVKGAAIATVIGNVVGALYYIIYFVNGKSILSISIKNYSYRNKIASGVLSIGIPAALASVLMSVSQIIMNSMMAEYGDMALAGVGVAMKITMITGMLSMGIGQGVQPLLGYCTGAMNWNRYHGIMRFSLVLAFIVSAVLTMLCYLFVNQIVGIFLTERSAFAYAVRFAKILLTTSTFFGVFFVFANALQAMGAATSSLIVNISRQGLIYIPSLFVLRAIIGINGLMWAQPVADVLSLILAISLYFGIFKRKKSLM
ncbi:MAG: MATE family efflux transporter [Treponema sp.]|jgi:multidrug efflux pump|nr:MATE family efflux transporter [Treponema sp.]